MIEKLQGKEYHVEFAKGNETTKRDITIRSVQVFPEGVTGYLYYAKDIVDQIAGRDVVLVDIGGKTTDIALVQGNKATDPYSVNVGTINIYDAIKKSLEMDERFLGKVEIKREKIQDYIDKGFYLNGEKQDIKKNIDASVGLFKQIYNELKLNYPISTSAVVVMGGGAKLLGEAFKKNIPGIIVMSDVDKHVFANAKGYKNDEIKKDLVYSMYNRLQIYDICNLLFLRRFYMTWSDLKEKILMKLLIVLIIN